MDEEKIREIQSRLIKLRFLAERKQTILRSIESQGKLTEKLAKQIQGAATTKRLEDLYLPYKPKKQTLATLARSRGLEELAQEILDAAPLAADLDRRAADFANPDRKVLNGADALLGAGHILAETFSERADLRQRLREILQRSGKLVSTGSAAEGKAAEKPADATAADVAVDESPDVAPLDETPETEEFHPSDADLSAGEELESPQSDPETAPEEAVTLEAASEQARAEPEPESLAAAVPSTPAVEPVADAGLSNAVASCAAVAETPVQLESSPQEPTAVEASLAASAVDAVGAAPAEGVAPAAEAPTIAPALPTVSDGAKKAKAKAKAAKAERKAELKKKKEEQKKKAFADYYNYAEEIKKIPPHRVLAINRGERAKVLRVKLECDLEAMYVAVDETCVPPDHPHADFLRGCARDALVRLVLPSLDREIRRELTERAESHAVEVFARNLRNLLLQPPIRDRRLLALDPGYKSGCKMVALDQFGNVLEHGVFYLIGKDDRRQEAAQRVADIITRHELQVVVIGNGTACRETEDFIGHLLGNELAGRGVAYVIVNEAGASVYSTSRLGREEFPQYDATARGAISIGRRLQDPLSELVKIDAANIGVGLYQHDVKAKHLRTSLDEVVESCVNFVGVDVNTASSALLRYVSGLNQLTARRVFEHRRQQGPFRTREQLKAVAGFGETTFVQAAGFLKIGDGDNPLDATWIHPESYDVALRALSKLGATPADLVDKDKAAKLAEQVAQVDLEQTAQELDVGVLTLKDILTQFKRPGRDPREDLPRPVFKQGVLKLEDLATGMELTGTILNVVDFGAFVDIGVHHSGLIHVSQLADKFIRDPHEVVAVGDIVKVWVLEVDKQRRRVSLTMIPPGSPRTHGRRPAKPEQASAAEGGSAAQAAPREGRPPERRDRDRDRDRDRRRPPQQGRGRPAGPPRAPYVPKPKPKKPVVPLSDEMKAGKAPLRSFSDLMQFYEFQQGPPPATGEKKEGSPPAADEQKKVEPPSEDQAK